MVTSTDTRNEYATLWHWTARALMAHGCIPADAVEGANLVLDAYRRERSAAGRERTSPRASSAPRITPIPEAPPLPAIPPKTASRTRTG